MASVVELKIPDLVQAAEYYESLLALDPQSQTSDGVTLKGDHVQVKLTKAAAKSSADTTVTVTCGMLARILDVAMKARCQIHTVSPEEVSFTDQYGQRWTLQCRVS